ncbi:MAG TPA: hypothetical protein VFW87_11715 [Pirellulales bacterium]|nr:hypothetical protein [Pirellulales bacterium]
MVTAISSHRPPADQRTGRWLSTGAEAQRRLQNSSYPSHRRLRCSFRAGVLIVQGRVPSYYQRQMAWALVADLDGIDRFVDRVEVVEPA